MSTLTTKQQYSKELAEMLALYYTNNPNDIDMQLLHYIRENKYGDCSSIPLLETYILQIPEMDRLNNDLGKAYESIINNKPKPIIKEIYYLEVDKDIGLNLTGKTGCYSSMDNVKLALSTYSGKYKLQKTEG